MQVPAIRARARKLLRDAGVVRPPVPVKKLVKRFGAVVKAVPFDQEFSGILLIEGDRKVIGVNQEESPERQRFSIAHELAHLIFHPEEGVHVDRSFSVQFRGPRSSAGIDQREVQANRFAAELLMPVDFLRADLQDKKLDELEDTEELIGRLAKRYQVSGLAMTIRLTNLGLGQVLGITDRL